MLSIDFEAIGTHWQIDFYHPLSKQRLAEVQKQVMQRIDEFDQVYSRFRSDSLVTSISREAGRYHFPDDGQKLFGEYLQLYELTNGKVTPLVGDLMVQSGYDPAYSLVPQIELDPVPSWPSAMSYDHPILETNRPLTLDFGAAGKGYLVDIVAELLLGAGVDAFIIDAGGDILQHHPDQLALRVGLEHPLDSSQAIGVLELSNESICASAGNRRQWAGRHHIVDPDTTDSVENVLATWVIAESALVADGLATALFFTEPQRLLEVYSFEYLLVRSDLTYDYSPGLRAELFTGARP